MKILRLGNEDTRKSRIVRDIEAGHTVKSASARSGISVKTMYAWIESDEQFRSQVAHAVHAELPACLLAFRDALAGDDMKHRLHAAEWLIARMDKQIPDNIDTTNADALTILRTLLEK